MDNSNSKPANGEYKLKEASGAESGLVYFILDRYYKSLTNGADSGRDNYIADIVGEMMKCDPWLMYHSDNPIAAFAFCGYPRKENRKFWDNKTALYIEGLAVLPERQGDDVVSELCRFFEKKALERNHDFLRINAPDKLVKICKNNGFEMVNADIRENYTLVFLEKRLGEQK